jgi:hypothetical protein
VIFPAGLRKPNGRGESHQAISEGEEEEADRRPWQNHPIYTFYVHASSSEAERDQVKVKVKVNSNRAGHKIHHE